MYLQAPLLTALKLSLSLTIKEAEIMKKSIILCILLSFVFIFHAQADIGDVDIHGFISQGFFQSDQNNFFENSSEGTFEFNEMGLNFGTKLSGKLRLGIQFFARDICSIGNDEIIVDWAYADYRWKQWLGLRIGKTKAAMGLYNEYRDVDMLRTGVLLPQAVYYEILRDSLLAITGAGIYGKIDMKIAGQLDYQFHGGGTNIDENSGSAHGIEGLGFPDISSIEVNRMFAWGLKWSTPVPGLLLGVSQTQIDLETNSVAANLTLKYEPFNAFVYSIEYMWNDLIITAEMNDMNIDPTLGAIGTDGSPMGPENLMGRYISVAYRFTDWLEAMVAYSEFYDNADDMEGKNKLEGREWEGWQKDWTLSLRFDINENWLFKLEGHLVNGVAQVLSTYMYDTEDKEDWNMFAAKVTYSF